jgi:hypothetical protein
VPLPTKGAGTLRRAVRSRAFAGIPGGRHMECAYYFEIPGGRHMECAYYFDFCRLCPVWLPSRFPRTTINASFVPPTPLPKLALQAPTQCVPQIG